MLNKDEINNSLLGYLLNKQSAQERQATEAWIRESTENRRYFEEFRQAHIRLQQAVQSEVIAGNYNQLQRKIRRRSVFRKAMRVAALITLMIGSGYGIYFLRQKPVTVAPVAQRTVHPGSSQAILHLSSGRIVGIDTSKQSFQEPDGTLITIAANGSVNYHTETPSSSGQQLLNRLEVPRGGEFCITLNDGTKVWLNSESELQYPTQFSEDQRIVYLKGEAYFDVAHLSQTPFIVKVVDMNVKVYGTQFNINSHVQGKIETVLVKGSIGISRLGNEEIMMQPNQKATYHNNRIKVEEVDPLPYTAWKNGFFMFHNETLEIIMDKLSRWYDVEVFYTANQAKTVRLSGMLERYKDVNHLLRYFEKISDVRFTVKGNTITVQ